MGDFKQFVKNSKENSEYNAPNGLAAIFGKILESDLGEHTHTLLGTSSSKKTNVLSEDKQETNSRRENEFHLRHESKEGYGKEYGKPLTRSQSTETARNAVAEHYSKSPEEQSSALEEAAARYGHTRYGKKPDGSKWTAKDVATRIRNDAGNSKTGMNVDHPLVNRAMSDGTTAKVGKNLGFGGTAASTTLKHSSKSDESTTINKCPHATKDCAVGHKFTDHNGKEVEVKPSCLAQSGGYEFPDTENKLKMEDYARHGSEMTKDHAILTAHAIKLEGQTQKKKGKVVDIRHQVTDQHGEYTQGITDEVVKHHPELKDHIHSYDYNKDHETVLRNLRDQKNGVRNIHGNFSHGGPTYRTDSDGVQRLNDDNTRRHGKFFHALVKADREGLDHRTYLVRGGRRVHEDGTPFSDKESGNAHQQPKSSATQEAQDEYRRTDALHKHTRYYSTGNAADTPEHLRIRHLEDHEPDEAHHEDEDGNGHGYTSVIENGKRVKVPYIQHRTNFVKGHGQTKPEERSDGAAGGVGHSRTQASSSVASASQAAVRGEHPNSLMHQMHDKTQFDRDSGILHVGNPHVMSKLGHKYMGANPEVKPISITGLKK